MNYPLWDVPVMRRQLGNRHVAIVHIYVSHFAVGRGAWLAMVEHLAYKKNDERLYDYLKSHSRFFVLVTTVFGAVFGVSIWFSISPGQPRWHGIGFDSDLYPGLGPKSISFS
ncbi:MAG: hypothetical protein R3D26_07650 [Cyanobacteriota/Melainabacteria group bacterium]